jgi:Prokaryotic phospholipase A2
VEHVGLLTLVALALATLLAITDVPASGLPAALARAIVPGATPDAERRGAIVRDMRTNAPSERRMAAPARDVVDGLMADDLDEFLAYRESPDRDPRLDFSTDLCTAPVLGSSGPTYDFTEACLRHDFGYRNYGPAGILGERRRDVDELFLADMRDHCLTRPANETISCLGWARTYYRAVRAFGWIPARQYD